MMATVIDDKSIGIEQHPILSLLCHFCGEPIIKLSGHDSDSLYNHHITYIPEVIVPVHHGCNVRYHNTHPDHPKNPEIGYRKRYIENLGGDIFCHFCEEEVTKFGVGSDRGANSLIIHSLDGNHDNWEPSNKVPAHQGCHIKYHASNRSEETLTKLSERMMGDKNPMKDPEVPAKAWKVKRGRYTSEEIFEICERGWFTRRERYGKSGCKGEHHTKRPEVRRAIGDANRGNSQIGIEAWKTRLERYGPTGMKPKGQAVV